ncbi:unnamed protein product [Caenorhabditis brenneri]
MQLLPVLLSTAILAVYGYGAGDYGTYVNGYYDYEDHRNECKKLKHYDFDLQNSALINHKAKFTHVERHGKDYSMISCPIDCQACALVAEHEGSVFRIAGDDYPDTAVLADGTHVSVLAKCDGKRITAETKDGDEIKLKKVACI